MEGNARQIASTADDSANSRSLFVLWRFSSEVVGATGFEPATPCAQDRGLALLRRCANDDRSQLPHLKRLERMSSQDIASSTVRIGSPLEPVEISLSRRKP